MAEAFAFLVVNDSPTSRFLIRCLLEQKFAGCLIAESASVEDALARTDARKFDAILTDSHLAGPEGSQFVYEARARGATCPFLVVTASSDPAAHERAYAAGASAVFYGEDLSFPEYLSHVLRPRDSGRVR